MITDYLDRPVAFQPAFFRVTGSVIGALFLSQAVYWAKRCPMHDDGLNWFYKTQEEWESEICMSRYEQEGARKILRSIGVLKEKRVGLPAKLYFSIDFEALELALEKTNSAQPSMRKTSNLDSGKLANTTAENSQSITETTTEITTEKKTLDGEQPPSAQQQPESKQDNLDYQAIVDTYHRLIPTMPAVRLLTEKRKKHIRAFWKRNKFDTTRWEQYLTYVATNCRWMTSEHRDTRGNIRKPKNLDYLITDDCYAAAAEGRFDDYQ